MLWIEYFVSNERAARGNYLFGIPDFIWKLFNLDQEFLPFGYRERSDKVSPRVIVLYKAKAASLCINFKLIDFNNSELVVNLNEKKYIYYAATNWTSFSLNVHFEIVCITYFIMYM